MNIKETPDKKGLTWTMRVMAYDTGLISVDGRPVSDQQDPAHSWLRASEVISTALTEFYRQMAKRHKAAT